MSRIHPPTTFPFQRNSHHHWSVILKEKAIMKQSPLLHTSASDADRSQSTVPQQHHYSYWGWQHGLCPVSTQPSFNDRTRREYS